MKRMSKKQNTELLDTVWKDANKDYLPFDKDVLGYYELPETNGKDKPTSKIFKYYVICHLDSITEGNGYKYIQWKDENYNYIILKYWTELPVPPDSK